MKRALICLVKYYPIIMNLYIVFIMLGSNFGIENPKLYPLIGQSFYINLILFILSRNLRFCYWHRLLIISMSLVLLLETLYNFGIHINYYIYICLIISVLSLILSTIIAIKENGLHKKKEVS